MAGVDYLKKCQKLSISCSGIEGSKIADVHQKLLSTALCLY